MLSLVLYPASGGISNQQILRNTQHMLNRANKSKAAEGGPVGPAQVDAQDILWEAYNAALDVKETRAIRILEHASYYLTSGRCVASKSSVDAIFEGAE